MICRIGITTDPMERRRYWESRYPRTFENWKILEIQYSKSAAQSRETALATHYSCESHPGGAGPEYATWHVYYFQHDGS